VRGAVMYAPGDVRVEVRSDPRILEATDAIIRVSAACVCGSDVWPYRGSRISSGPHQWVTCTPGSSRRSRGPSPPPVPPVTLEKLHPH
jgi:D-arabinose 1-dehydrogenase-like Zn-dependent alcohol dehydrogenase